MARKPGVHPRAVRLLAALFIVLGTLIAVFSVVMLIMTWDNPVPITENVTYVTAEPQPEDFYVFFEFEGIDTLRYDLPQNLCIIWQEGDTLWHSQLGAIADWHVFDAAPESDGNIIFSGRKNIGQHTVRRTDENGVGSYMVPTELNGLFRLNVRTLEIEPILQTDDERFGQNGRFIGLIEHISVDGNNIMFIADQYGVDTGGDSEIFVYNVESDELVQLTENAYWEEYPSNRNDYIAYQLEDDVVVLSVNNTTIENAQTPDWSPNGYLLALEYGADIVVWGEDSFARINDDNRWSFEPSWTLDGTGILYSSQQHDEDPEVVYYREIWLWKEDFHAPIASHYGYYMSNPQQIGCITN